LKGFQLVHNQQFSANCAFSYGAILTVGGAILTVGGAILTVGSTILTVGGAILTVCGATVPVSRIWLRSGVAQDSVGGCHD
jgi:membrane-bound ClpP family serine protease